MTPEPLCPSCRSEGVQLPEGGLLCQDHGRYDLAGDQARDRERERASAFWALENAHLGITPPTCPDCGGSGLKVDAHRRAGDRLTAEEVEMLDSTRCHLCCGDGYLTDHP